MGRMESRSIFSNEQFISFQMPTETDKKNKTIRQTEGEQLWRRDARQWDVFGETTQQKRRLAKQTANSRLTTQPTNKSKDFKAKRARLTFQMAQAQFSLNVKCVYVDGESGWLWNWDNVDICIGTKWGDGDREDKKRGSGETSSKSKHLLTE